MRMYMLAGIWRVNIKNSRIIWVLLKDMAVPSEIFSRQLSLAGTQSVSLWWVLKDLKCHYQDEVVINGGLTGVAVPPFACKFTPDGLHGNLLAVADEEGSVRLLDTRKRTRNSLIIELSAHSNAIFDLVWLPGGTQMVTASGDTSLCLWDIVNGSLLTTFKAHSGSVKSVDVNKDEPTVFVSGGRDGNILVWDTRCSTKGSKYTPVNCISMAHKRTGTPSVGQSKTKNQRSNSLQKPLDAQHSVTAVLFHGDKKIASAGSADGTVKLWDLRRTYTNCKLKPPLAWHVFSPTGDSQRPFGFTSMVSDPFKSCLFASCTDDIIYTYDTSRLCRDPVNAFSGHQNKTFYVKADVSHDGKYLLSGSSCGNAFIWEIKHPENPPLMLSGHSKEVTAVNWCPTQLDKIATCSDNNDIRVWRVVRKSESLLPGETIGTCEQYSGEGHKRAAEVIQGYLKNIDSPCQKKCTPLQHIQNTFPPSSASKHQKSPGLRRFMCAKENNLQTSITSQKDSNAFNGTTTSAHKTCTCSSKTGSPSPPELSMASQTPYCDSEQHLQFEGWPQSLKLSPLSSNTSNGDVTPNKGQSQSLKLSPPSEITPEREPVATAVISVGAKKRRLCLEERKVDKASPRQRKESEENRRKRRRKSLSQKETQGSNCNGRKSARKANSAGHWMSDTKEPVGTTKKGLHSYFSVLNTSN